MEREKEIIRIIEEVSEKNKRGAGVLGLMAGAAIQRFEPEGRKHVPRLYNYFQNCLNEGVSLEMIREVVRLARE